MQNMKNSFVTPLSMKDQIPLAFFMNTKSIPRQRVDSWPLDVVVQKKNNLTPFFKSSAGDSGTFLKEKNRYSHKKY